MTAGEPFAPALRLPAWGLLRDDRLARLARRGDRRAFETIFRRYEQELYRFCQAILGDPHEAHDALQSTMEAALRALPDDERRIALRPWLFRVAHNESISILRRRTAVVDPAALPEAASPVGDPQAEQRERLRQLIADLDALPDRQRGALVMRELSGLAYSEIGDSLGASEGAARQIVYEARIALRHEAQGRELECDEVRIRLSERDGRVLRGRLLRAHLRSCEPCRDFRAAIGQRRTALRALSPPLTAAPGLLAALLERAGKTGAEAAGSLAAGAGGTGAGAVGTGLGVATTSIGSSAALKATSIAATVAIGAGAAGFTGAVDLPLGSSSHDSARAGSATTPADPPRANEAERSPAAGRSDVGSRRAAGANSSPATGGPNAGSSREHGRATAQGGPPAHAANAGGSANSSAAHPRPGPPASAGDNGSWNGVAAQGNGPPASPPGQTRDGSAPSGSPPAQPKGLPAHSQGEPPGNGPPDQIGEREPPP
jgi:RNA polymerase sigma factor (sigma-70 family)